MSRKEWPPQDWGELERKLADKLQLTLESIEKNNNLKPNKMKKNATITKSNFSRTWNGNNGEVHYYDLTLDNGDKGQIGTKTKDNPKLAVGETITYSIEAKGEYKGVTQYTIKLEQADQVSYNKAGSGSYGKPEDPETRARIARSVCIDAAVALHVGLGLSPEPYDVVNTALYFQHYIETGQNLHADGATDAIKNRDSDNDVIPF